MREKPRAPLEAALGLVPQDDGGGAWDGLHRKPCGRLDGAIELQKVAGSGGLLALGFAHCHVAGVLARVRGGQRVRVQQHANVPRRVAEHLAHWVCAAQRDRVGPRAKAVRARCVRRLAAKGVAQGRRRGRILRRGRRRGCGEWRRRAVGEPPRDHLALVGLRLRSPRTLAQREPVDVGTWRIVGDAAAVGLAAVPRRLERRQCLFQVVVRTAAFVSAHRDVEVLVAVRPRERALKALGDAALEYSVGALAAQLGIRHRHATRRRGNVWPDLEICLRGEPVVDVQGEDGVRGRIVGELHLRHAAAARKPEPDRHVGIRARAVGHPPKSREDKVLCQADGTGAGHARGLQIGPRPNVGVISGHPRDVLVGQRHAVVRVCALRRRRRRRRRGRAGWRLVGNWACARAVHRARRQRLAHATVDWRPPVRAREVVGRPAVLFDIPQLPCWNLAVRLGL